MCKRISTKQRAKQDKASKEESNKSLISHRTYRRKHCNKNLLDERHHDEQTQRMLEHDIVRTSQFEVGKEYQRYFKKGNKSLVVGKLSKNNMKEFKKIDSRYLSFDGLDKLFCENLFFTQFSSI